MKRNIDELEKIAGLTQQITEADDFEFYKLRNELGDALKTLGNKLVTVPVSSKYDPDSDRFSQRDMAASSKVLKSQLKKVAKLEAELRTAIEWTYKF